MDDQCSWTRSPYWYAGALVLVLVCTTVSLVNRIGPGRTAESDSGSLGTLLVEFPERARITVVPVLSYGRIEGFPAGEIHLDGKRVQLHGPADYELIARADAWIQKYPVHIQGSNDEIQLKVVPPPVRIPEDMVFIPAGEFRIGAKVPLRTVDGAATPTRDVAVGAFLLDQYEVSNAAFTEFVRRGGYEARKYWSDPGWRWLHNAKVGRPRFMDDPLLGQAKHPVVGVSWYEADAYCRFKNKRLPDEAEWEKAARGPRGYRWSFGNSIESGGGQANSFGAVDGYPKTAPVDAFAPNGFGLFNMSGNVWEWVDSEYGKNDEFSENWYRVLRGGSWGSFSEYLRVAYRGADDPGISADSYGFRCARDP